MQPRYFQAAVFLFMLGALDVLLAWRGGHYSLEPTFGLFRLCWGASAALCAVSRARKERTVSRGALVMILVFTWVLYEAWIALWRSAAI